MIQICWNIITVRVFDKSDPSIIDMDGKRPDSDNRKYERGKGRGGFRTLQKPKEEGEESTRKSSTRHPGSISIKYSDILLLADPWLPARPFSILAGVLQIPGWTETGSSLTGFCGLKLGTTSIPFFSVTDAAEEVEEGGGGE